MLTLVSRHQNLEQENHDIFLRVFLLKRMTFAYLQYTPPHSKTETRALSTSLQK